MVLAVVSALAITIAMLPWMISFIKALSIAHIPSRLEPSGLDSSDGKRPDGITMVPWKSGNPLVWDATCSIPMPPLTWHSPLWQQVLLPVGQRIQKKDQILIFRRTARFGFHTCCCRTIRSTWPSFPDLPQRAGHRVTTGDTGSYAYLLQRLSVAIQMENAASIRGTLPSFADLYSV